MYEYEKLINNIVWWIPFKKARNMIRQWLLQKINKINEMTNKINEMTNKINEMTSYNTKHIENIEHQQHILNRSINKNIVYISVSNWCSNSINSLEKFFLFKLFEQILKKYDKVAVYNSYNPDIEIFSVFGDKQIIKNFNSKVKIFYTGEEVYKNYINYSNHCLDITDLSIGFDYLQNSNYIRIPLWIVWYFSNEILNADKQNIAKTIEYINTSKFNKTKFCALISTHDNNYGNKGMRSAIYKKLSKIDKINCPSQLFHNDDDLKNIFGDNKIEYLKQFKFNICPENCISPGYITEKLLDAFMSSCIPIWGGGIKIWSLLLLIKMQYYIGKKTKITKL